MQIQETNFSREYMTLNNGNYLKIISFLFNTLNLT